MFLTNTYALVMVLDGASAVVKHVAFFEDESNENKIPQIQLGVSNGTSLVVLVAGSADGTKRKIKEISIYNGDAATKIVTVSLNDGSSLWPIQQVSLTTQKTLNYHHQRGWYVTL